MTHIRYKKLDEFSWETFGHPQNEIFRYHCSLVTNARQTYGDVDNWLERFTKIREIAVYDLASNRVRFHDRLEILVVLVRTQTFIHTSCLIEYSVIDQRW